MELKWIKMDTGMFGTNRAIRQIEGMADGDTLLVIWFKLLLLAGRTADGGRIELIPGMPTTPEMLAVELARPLDVVERALSVFSSFGMLERRQMRIVDFVVSQGGKSTESKEEKPTPKKIPAPPRNESEEDPAERLLALHEEEEKKRTVLGGTLGKGVLLISSAQLDDLAERLSPEELEKYAGVVVNCELSGKHFTKRNHYEAILDMALKDRRIAENKA